MGAGRRKRTFLRQYPGGGSLVLSFLKDQEAKNE